MLRKCFLKSPFQLEQLSIVPLDASGHIQDALDKQQDKQELLKHYLSG